MTFAQVKCNECMLASIQRIPCHFGFGTSTSTTLSGGVSAAEADPVSLLLPFPPHTHALLKPSACFAGCLVAQQLLCPAPAPGAWTRCLPYTLLPMICNGSRPKDISGAVGPCHAHVHTCRLRHLAPVMLMCIHAVSREGYDTEQWSYVIHPQHSSVTGCINSSRNASKSKSTQSTEWRQCASPSHH